MDVLALAPEVLKMTIALSKNYYSCCKFYYIFYSFYFFSMWGEGSCK